MTKQEWVIVWMGILLALLIAAESAILAMYLGV